jgi:hypothetical protein
MGERVRYERTSDRGDPDGSVNPTRSKVEQGAWAARPVPGNGYHPQVDRSDGWPPRSARDGQNPAYRPAHRHHLPLDCHL